jgi:hypothetical protein
MPQSRAAFNFEVTKSPEGGLDQPGAIQLKSKKSEKGKRGSRRMAGFHFLFRHCSRLPATIPGQQKGAEPVGPAPAVKIPA